MQSLSADSQLAADQLYLTIYLTDTTVQSALWQLHQGQVEIKETSDSHTYADEKSCLIETDKSLQELGSGSEGVGQTVFGFEPTWVDKDGIVDSRKPLLKKLTESLSLEPVGFVVSDESIVGQALKSEPLLSAILIELRSKEIKAIILQRGTSLGGHTVGRSGDPSADMIEVLARFKDELGQDNLPSKIILFSNQLAKEELDEQQQQLLAQNWTESQPFLHQPDITVKPTNYLLEVITNQAAISVGGSVGETMSGSAPALGLAGVVAPPEEATSLADEFGFTDASDSPSADVASDPDPAVMPETAIDTQEVRSFGIPMPVSSLSPQMDELSEPAEYLPDDDQPTSAKKSSAGWLKKLSLGGKQPSSHRPFMIAGFVGGLLILLGLGMVFARTSYRAMVTVVLASQNISKETQITLDPDISQADIESLSLPAKLVAKEASGQDSISTTGVKLVGDKATGTVTIFNKTTSEKTFPTGTTLSLDGLDFVTDQEVTVPAASVSETEGGDGETKTYGKENVAVTASEIGAEGNIEKDKELAIASFDSSTYSATSTDVFSGGSSREVRVVSDDDVVTLRQQLTNALSEDAQEKLTQEADSGQYFIPTGETEVVSSKFNAEVGDEVQTLELDLTVAASAYVYNNQDLKPLAVALLDSEIPQGFRLSDQDPQILSSPKEDATSSGQVTLEANVSSQAVPEVDQSQLIRDILGLPIEQAISNLQSKPAIKQAKITVEPSYLQRMFSKLPKNGDKIELVIEE